MDYKLVVDGMTRGMTPSELLESLTAMIFANHEDSILSLGSQSLLRAVCGTEKPMNQVTARFMPIRVRCCPKAATETKSNSGRV